VTGYRSDPPELPDWETHSDEAGGTLLLPPNLRFLWDDFHGCLEKTHTESRCGAASFRFGEIRREVEGFALVWFSERQGEENQATFATQPDAGFRAPNLD
jgi:hypothetical protein